MSKMISSSLSHFILLIAILHKSQCEEDFWQQIKTRNWEPKDALTCYTTVTLELFENLKKVVDVLYVEQEEADFKSKCDVESDFFSFLNNSIEKIPYLFRKKMNKIESTAKKGIFSIFRWLGHYCTYEKPKQILEFTKIFKEGRAKCVGAPFYLNNSIWWLERSCRGRENTFFVTEKHK